MVVDTLETPQTDRLFRALADPTRRDIVMRTMSTELSVSALARLYPMSFAAVQKHVAVLERARLVTKHRSGREQLVRGNGEAVNEARRQLDRLEEMWRGRIERAGELLKSQETKGEKT
jgi:DNA-binding transcriptional ArsR family regulator